MQKPEFTKETFAKYFNYLLQQRNMTTREVFQKTGISRSYLDELKNGTKPAPRREKLDLIKDALGLNKSETNQFYSKADTSFAEYRQKEQVLSTELEQKFQNYYSAHKKKKKNKKKKKEKGT